VTYNFKNLGGYSSHIFWRGFVSYFLGVFFSHTCSRLRYIYIYIDKNCGSLEEHRVVTWAGGVVVSTVQETVFVEAYSVSVAFSCPAAGLVC